MIKTLKQLVENSRQLRFVDRLATHSIIQRQNVAEHSFSSSMIGLALCQEALSNGTIVGEEAYNALKQVLTHDVNESITSDILFNIKRYSTDMRDAVGQMEKDLESKFLKGIYQHSPISDLIEHLSDMADLHLHLKDEIFILSNKNLQLLKMYYHTYISSIMMSHNLNSELIPQLLGHTSEYEMTQNIIKDIFAPLMGDGFNNLRPNVTKVYAKSNVTHKVLNLTGIPRVVCEYINNNSEFAWGICVESDTRKCDMILGLGVTSFCTKLQMIDILDDDNFNAKSIDI